MRFSPLFAKEGKGRFSDGMTRELCRELLRQDTSVILTKAATAGANRNPGTKGFWIRPFNRVAAETMTLAGHDFLSKI